MTRTSCSTHSGRNRTLEASVQLFRDVLVMNEVICCFRLLLPQWGHFAFPLSYSLRVNIAVKGFLHFLQR